MSTDDIFFMPLGGGQYVGASCYFLRIGKTNIILDAGTGMKNGLKIMPDTYSLEISEFLQSMSQIDYIFISHAHMDHVGYLPMLAKQASHAKIFMTDLTASLTEYQLNDRQGMMIRQMMDKVIRVSFMEERYLGKIKITFLPAGHIPGAMMVLFQYNGRNILYTGDYSTGNTLLTEGCILPNDIKIDTLITCGLHAKHPFYQRGDEHLDNKVRSLINQVNYTKRSIVCQTTQLSKGLELLKMINEVNKQEAWQIPIYLNKGMQQAVLALEKQHIPLLEKFNHPIMPGRMDEPGIILANGKSFRMCRNAECVNIDFALHDDFQKTKEFICSINPRYAVMVHTAPPRYYDDYTLEQVLMRDADCRSQLLFPEDGMVYKL